MQRFKKYWFVPFLIVVPLVVFVLQPVEPKNHTTPHVTPIKEVQLANKELITTLKTYHHVQGEQKTAALEHAKKIAKQRKASMLYLMKRSPQLAASTDLSRERDNMPSAIQPFIEHPAVVTGNLIPIRVEGKQTQTVIYALKLPNKQYLNTQLAFQSDMIPKENPQHATIAGSRLDDTFLVKSVDDVQLSPSKPQKVLQAATPAIKTLAIILFNWSNYTTQSPDKASISSKIFNGSDSIKNYFLEVSENRMTVEGKRDPVNGDVFGWITIPDTIGQTASGYGDADCYSGGKMEKWMDTAEQMASSQYGDMSTYDYIGFATPMIDCPGAVGFSSGNRIWTMGDFFNQHLIAHELGHSFGLSHSNGIHCTTISGTIVTLHSAGCSIGNDEDPYDPMGYGNYPHYSVYNKEKLGWYDPSNIQTVTSTGTYTLAPMEGKRNAVQVLKIAKGTAYYYLGFRQPYGFDRISNFKEDDTTDLTPYNVYNGVLIRLAPNQNTGFAMTCSFCDSALLDAHPQTKAFTDAALELGQTYIDPDAKIRIRTDSVNSQQAKVSISLNDEALPPLPQVSPTGPVPTFACVSTPGKSICPTIVPSTTTQHPSINPPSLAISDQPQISSQPNPSYPSILQPCQADQADAVNSQSWGHKRHHREKGLIQLFIEFILQLLMFLFTGNNIPNLPKPC